MSDKPTFNDVFTPEMEQRVAQAIIDHPFGYLQVVAALEMLALVSSYGVDLPMVFGAFLDRYPPFGDMREQLEAMLEEYKASIRGKPITVIFDGTQISGNSE